MGTRRAVKSASSQSAGSKRPPAAKRSVKRTAAADTKGGQRNEDTEVASDVPESSRFDPSMDRRIIEGMLDDRENLMREMRDKGINQPMVLRRAAELGLSEALIRQVRGVAADLAGERPGKKVNTTQLGARTCLCCDRVFLSTGASNRLCMRCRGGDAGLAAL